MKSVFSIVLALSFIAFGAEDNTDELVGMIIEGAKNDVQRAAKLNEAAAGLEDNPLVRKNIFLKAFDYGMKSPTGMAEAEKSLAAIESGQLVKGDELLALKLKFCRRKYSLSRGQEKKAAAGVLIDVLVSSAEPLIKAGKASDGLKILREALNIASASGNKDQAAVLRARIKEAGARVVLERRVESLREKLKKDPKDQKARKALIDFHIIELDDPAGAAKLITDDTDLELSTYVKYETGGGGGDWPADGGKHVEGIYVSGTP